MSARDERRLVLVVGVGRSGTSLLAGILGQVGFHIPQPEVTADETNPRGFGEPRWVVDFHRKLMSERRVTVFDARPAAWDSTRAATEDPAVHAELREWLGGQFEQGGSVVVKDPRIGWFLPLWLRCAADLEVPTSFVTMLRHPAEILVSARRSYGDWQSDASRAASWLNVMLETERATRDSPRAFVRYADLLSGWGGQLTRLGQTLDLPPLAGFDPSKHPEVDRFVDPSLYRSRQSWEDLAVPARVEEQAEAVWAVIQGLAEPDRGRDAIAASLDAARERYVEMYAEAEAISQSSVTAVKPRKKRAQAPSAPKPPPSLRVRIARRIPARHRQRIRRVIGSLGRSS